jgi:hypothetical protein
MSSRNSGSLRKKFSKSHKGFLNFLTKSNKTLKKHQAFKLKKRKIIKILTSLLPVLVLFDASVQIIGQLQIVERAFLSLPQQVLVDLARDDGVLFGSPLLFTRSPSEHLFSTTITPRLRVGALFVVTLAHTIKKTTTADSDDNKRDEFIYLSGSRLQAEQSSLSARMRV